MNKVKDLSGFLYGQLAVVKREGIDKSGNATWLCLCSCGRHHIVRADCLKSGAIKSCGCLGRYTTKIRSTTHGMSKSKEYRIWTGVKSRCSDAKNISFKNYGGRGIKVCKEWENFETFYADMGPCPVGYSIERIKLDVGYEPSNCVWIPLKMQNRNKRNTIYHEGLNTNELAVKYGLTVQAVIARLSRNKPLDVPMRRR